MPCCVPCAAAVRADPGRQGALHPPTLQRPCLPRPSATPSLSRFHAVDNVPYMLGRLPAAACVRWVEGKPTLVHLIPRPGRTDAEVSAARHAPCRSTACPGRNTRCSGTLPQGRPLQPRTFTAPPLFVFHHANAFESADGRRVSVDSIHYDSLPAVGREALAEQQASCVVCKGQEGG